MSPDEQERRRAAEDRAAWREEIAREDADGRLDVFDALAKDSEDGTEELPPMPDGLRDRLIDKFGPGVPTPVDAKDHSGRGLLARLRALFAQRPLAFGGGLAAACALLLVILLPLGPGSRPGGGDRLRGGGTELPSADNVALYLYPAAPAQEVRALMNPGRAVSVCRDAAEFEQRLAKEQPEWAVALDVTGQTIATYFKGERRSESPVATNEPMDLLIELRAAIDAITTEN